MILDFLFRQVSLVKFLIGGFLSLSLLALFGACKRDVYGCMLSRADNYNPEATRNDGSCTYTPALSFVEEPEQVQTSDNTYTVSVKLQSNLPLDKVFCVATSTLLPEGPYFTDTIKNPEIGSTVTFVVKLPERNMLGEHKVQVTCLNERETPAKSSYSFDLVDLVKPFNKTRITVDSSEIVRLWEQKAFDIDGEWSDNYMLDSANISLWEVDYFNALVQPINDSIYVKKYQGRTTMDQFRLNGPAIDSTGGVGKAAFIVEVHDAGGQSVKFQTGSFDAKW